MTRAVPFCGVLALFLCVVPACVVERTPSRGATTSGASLRAQSAVASAEPVASPATNARSRSSAARVALEPLGVIPYDGLVLPLFSPDGKYLATQTGEAPTWEVLLAAGKSANQPRTRVQVMDLSQLPIRRIDALNVERDPLLLGLCCNHAGFYVESPRADGTRWIGAVEWPTGALKWIVDGKAPLPAPPRSPGFSVTRFPMLATNAVAASEDDLSEVWALAIRNVFDTVFTLGTWPYRTTLLDRYPIGDFVAPLYFRRERWYCFLSHSGASALLVFTLSPQGYLTVSSPQAIAVACEGDTVPVYKAAASASIAHQPMDAEPFFTDAILFFQPCSHRMVIVPADLSVMPLAQDSIAGCWAATKTGPAVLVTTSDGLHLQRLSKDQTGWRAEEPVRLLREPYVPRATTNPDRPYILIGPADGTPDQPHRLQIVAMRIIEE